jgi:hypothetical protein
VRNKHSPCKGTVTHGQATQDEQPQGGNNVAYLLKARTCKKTKDISWSQWTNSQNCRKPTPSQSGGFHSSGSSITYYFCRFGIQCELHSAQGRNVESRLLQKILQSLRVSKTCTTPLQPLRTAGRDFNRQRIPCLNLSSQNSRASGEANMQLAVLLGFI